MNTKIINRPSRENIVSSLEELSKESQVISPDDNAAFKDWDKRFKDVCRAAGKEPFELCCNFYKQHSPGPIILGEVTPESRDEIAGKLKDAPDYIRAIIDIVKIHGIVPIKRNTRGRKNTRLKS